MVGNNHWKKKSWIKIVVLSGKEFLRMVIAKIPYNNNENSSIYEKLRVTSLLPSWSGNKYVWMWSQGNV